MCPNVVKENSSLGGGSVELCSRGGLLGVHPKASQCPISVRNWKAYEEYISMNNIILVQGLLGERTKLDNIIPMWIGKSP